MHLVVFDLPLALSPIEYSKYNNSEQQTSMKLATGITIIKNGQLIDGTGRAPILDAALVICDGRIIYAGPEAE